jgi:hypothetical protein
MRIIPTPEEQAWMDAWAALSEEERKRIWARRDYIQTLRGPFPPLVPKAGQTMRDAVLESIAELDAIQDCESAAVPGPDPGRTA